MWEENRDHALRKPDSVTTVYIAVCAPSSSGGVACIYAPSQVMHGLISRAENTFTHFPANDASNTMFRV